MSAEPPEVWVIGGCNGSGKTTFALNIFPNLGNVEFINADIIAAKLNPDNPDVVAIQASRMMLERLKNLVQEKQSFAFETTLAARSVLVSVPLRLTSARGLTASHLSSDNAKPKAIESI